ncbi:MAG: DUF5979 domain-containing protein, partial [Candidatus Limnocylindrales bacterium]
MDTNIRRGRRATAFRRVGWLAVAAMVATALFATPGVALGQSVTSDCYQIVVDFSGAPAGTTADVYLHGTTTLVPGGELTASGYVAAPSGIYDVVWSNDGSVVSTDTVTVPACGELQITKSISGTSADFPGGQFDFAVDCGGTDTFTTSISIAAGGSAGSVHFSVLPGETCAVTETGTPDAGPGYLWLAPQFLGNPATIVEGQTVTVSVTDPRNPTASPPPSPSPSSPPTSPPCT